jgi:hypothetical protein
MGHHLIDDALENQAQWEPISYGKEMLEFDYIKIPFDTILNTPNDQELGELVRDKYLKLLNK